MKIKHVLAALLFSSLIIASCKKDNPIPSNPADEKIYFSGYIESTGHSFKIEYNADKTVKTLTYADDDSRVDVQPVYFNNKLSKLKKSEDNGSFVSIISYETDDKGRVTKRTYLNNSSSPNPYTTYEYDSDNHIKKTEDFSASGTSQGSVIYTYDNDNIIKCEDFSISSTRIITYTFDNKLNPYFSIKDLFFIGDIDFTALSKNNILSSSDKAATDQTNFSETSLNYTYNAQGYPATMTDNTTSVNLGKETKETFNYTFNYIK